MGPLVIIIVLFFMAYLPLQWSATKTLKRHIGPGFIISYLVPLTLGMALPSAPFFFVVVLIMFLATTRDRLDAACRFIMLAMLMPDIVWRAQIGSAYLLDIRTIDVLGLALLIQCALKPDRKALPMRGFTVEDGFVAVFFLILWIGAGRFPSASIILRGSFTQATLLLLPYLALRRSLRSSEEFMRLTACLAVASGILATFAIYETLHGWTLFGLYSRLSDNTGMSKGLFLRGGVLRAPATMSSALMLGMVLLVGLGATFYSRRYVRQGWMLAGWGVVIFAGMMMTQSRGNTALLPLSALIFCLQRRKYGFAAMIGIGTPLGLAIVMALARVSPRIGAFLNVGAEQTNQLAAGVYDYRQLLLQRGMEVAAMHRWTGASLSYVIGQLADITQGQGIVDMVNTYLTLYLVSGLAGMIPFFVLFAIIWWKLLVPRGGKRAGPEFHDMKGFALSTLAVVAVQLSFLSFLDRVPLCLMLALVPARMAGIERIRLGRSRRIEPAPAVQPDPAAQPQRA